MHIYGSTYKCNVLSPFSVPCICVSRNVREPIGDSSWMTHSLFLRSGELFVTLHLRVWPHYIFSIYTEMAILVATFRSCLGSHIVEISLFSFPGIARGHNRTADLLVLWLLQPFSPVSVMYLCNCAIHLLSVPFQPLTPILRQLLIVS